MRGYMSPTSVAALLLLAFVIDYLSVGPDSFRDRLASAMAVVGFNQGFDDSPADGWTLNLLVSTIDSLKDRAEGAYIASAVSVQLVGVGITLLWLYYLGCLMPDKMSKKLGRLAAMRLPATGVKRVNWKLWGVAFLLGIFCDLPQGWGGEAVRFFVVTLTGLLAPVPQLIFGIL